MAQTISDLIEIGPPESWPHGRRDTQPIGPAQLRDAKILSVSTRDDEVTIGVKGPNLIDGTLSTFVIKDADLRTRIMGAIRPGMDVYEAAAAPL